MKNTQEGENLFKKRQSLWSRLDARDSVCCESGEKEGWCAVPGACMSSGVKRNACP